MALAGCEDRLAGSSVITGNPTEIQVGFAGGNNPAAFSGRVEIYGATQVPVPGFRPEPLARIDVDGKQEFTLDAGRLEAIADSLWPEGSLVGDSLARFNLVALGEKEGAIVRDLAYLVGKGRFHVEEGHGVSLQNGKARLAVNLAALKESKAYLSHQGLDSNRINYMFLKGTGFASLSSDGVFRFSLPEGSHTLSFLTLPSKGNSTGPEDTAFINVLDRPLMSGGQDTLEVGEVEFRLPMPDRYMP